MRKKKTTAKEAPLSNELSVEQVYDVLKFADTVYRGIYSPDLVNSIMKSITMNTQEASLENITSALQNPKENEQKLIGYSEFMELNSMLYRRILLYFSGLMSFDWTYVCSNVDNPKEYKSAAYKKDLSTVASFFNRFNVKQEFRVALKQMLRQEAFYSIFRDDGEKYVLQELPQYYSKITGRWDFGLTFDFNFIFFLQPGTNLDMYPKIFKKLYGKAFQGKDILQYNPALSINQRDSSFAYWVQTSPKDGFAAFKLFPEIASVIPMLAPLLGDAVMQPVIRSLQTNSYIQQASKLVFGQVEFLKDASTKVKDALSLDPVTLGKFLALLKAGIPDVIKIGAAPLANTTAIEFTGDNGMYDSYLKSTASVSGVNSRLIYSFDRQNVLIF